MNLKSGYKLEQIHRTVENPSLLLFRARRVDEELLVKMYRRGSLEDALRESLQNGYFRPLPFIPALVYEHVSPKRRAILAYKWIDGKTGYDIALSEDRNSPMIEEWTFQQLIDNVISLGNFISSGDYLKLSEIGTRFSMESPIYRGFFTPAEESQFNKAYVVVTNGLEKACKLFPGLYTDRNPSNWIVQEDMRRVYLLDFGLVEATSPIFDLTKLLRTWTGEPPTKGDVQDPSDRIISHDINIEREFLQYAYGQFIARSNHYWAGSFDEFAICFIYAALNEHIFYLTKSEGLLREGRADKKVQDMRRGYHSRMLSLTYEQLKDHGEPVSDLGSWINRLVHI